MKMQNMADEIEFARLMENLRLASHNLYEFVKAHGCEFDIDSMRETDSHIDQTLDYLTGSEF